MFIAYVTVPCTSSHPWYPQGLYKQKKNRIFSRKALKSKVWSPRWGLVPLNVWHQILLQVMANLSPTSIAKFGLQAPPSHHFPLALPLANEISGTEIDGSFKEDVKEKLEHYVCICPLLPRASLFPKDPGEHSHRKIFSAVLGTAWSHSASFPMSGTTAWSHSPVPNEKNHSLETLICQQHHALCCANTPELMLHLQSRAFL